MRAEFYCFQHYHLAPYHRAARLRWQWRALLGHGSGALVKDTYCYLTLICLAHPSPRRPPYYESIALTWGLGEFLAAALQAQVAAQQHGFDDRVARALTWLCIASSPPSPGSRPNFALRSSGNLSIFTCSNLVHRVEH
jgi:hypothetical protein